MAKIEMRFRFSKKLGILFETLDIYYTIPLSLVLSWNSILWFKIKVYVKLYLQEPDNEEKLRKFPSTQKNEGGRYTAFYASNNLKRDFLLT